MVNPVKHAVKSLSNPKNEESAEKQWTSQEVRLQQFDVLRFCDSGMDSAHFGFLFRIGSELKGKKEYRLWLELEERHLNQRILKNQLEIVRLTLKEMKRGEKFEKRVRKRKFKGYPSHT